MLDLRAYTYQIHTKLDHGCHGYQDIAISNSDKMHNRYFVDQIFNCLASLFFDKIA